MNFRIERNFSWNLPIIVPAERVKQPVVEQATAAKVSVSNDFSSKMKDIGTSLLRQQLQSKALTGNILSLVKRAPSVAKVTSVAAPAPKPKVTVEAFNPNVALGFFGKLAGGFLGGLVSNVVGKLANKLPETLIQTGFKIGSAIFGGEGGKGIDPETRGYLESFGLDPQAVSAARLYFNTPNGFKGFATTIGDNIHFQDRPEPRYWLVAAELKRLIDTGAPAETIREGQEKLRASIDDFSLLAHEVNHVAQQKREGLVGFVSQYAADFAGGFVRNLFDQALDGSLDIKNIFSLDRDAPLGKAYRDVGFEREAKNLQLEEIEPKLLGQYADLLN